MNRRFATLAAALALAATPLLAADRGEAEAAMRRAVAAFDGGDPRTAKVEMQNALKADPGWGVGHVLMARIALVLDDAGLAEAELGRAGQAGIPAAEIAHLTAHAAVLRGDAVAALAALDANPVPAKQAAYALRVRGQAFAIKGEFSAAEAALNQSLELSPDDAETWIAVARFRMDAADQAGAVFAADKAVALAPDSADAAVLKGVLVRNQYGLAAALPWFEKAIELDGQNVDALIEAAATLGDLDRNKDMLAMTRRAIALGGGNGRAFYLQAVMAARAGNYGLARSLIERTGDALDGSPGANLLRAVLEIDAGSYEMASGRLERLVQWQPENARARRLLGTAQWRAGNFTETVDALRPLADRPDADAYVLTLTGRALEALGDRTAAATYLDRAAAPGGVPALFADRGDQPDDGTAPARIRRIRGLLAAGQGEQALSESRALQEAHPGTPAAHVLAGDVLLATGDPRGAAEAYRAAANINFNEPVALRLIDALNAAGQPGAAIATLRLFLEQNPRNVSALLMSADYLQQNGDNRGAIRVLEGLRARLGNGDALVLNNLAWAYLRNGEGEKGLAYAARAYRLSPGNPATADAFGWLLTKTGANKRAGIELLEKARALAPAAPGVQWHLAQAYAEAGRKPEALRAARMAQAAPNFAEAAQVRAFIEKL